MSSDEEDLHQCGRCKNLFHSLDQYFQHKKSRTCQKVKANQNGKGERLSSGGAEQQEVAERTPHSEQNGLEGTVPTPPSSQDQSEAFNRQEMSFSTISQELADTLQDNRAVVAPAKKRLAARELALKQPGADSGATLVQKSGGSEAPVEKKGRGSKRRPTAKNMKKAWAENYKDSVDASQDIESKPPTVTITHDAVESTHPSSHDNVEPSLKRPRVHKGESLSSGSSPLDDSNAVTDPSHVTRQESTADEGEIHQQTNTKHATVRSKRKKRGRPKATGRTAVGGGRKSSKQGSSAIVHTIGNPKEPRGESGDWAGGDEGNLILDFEATASKKREDHGLDSEGDAECCDKENHGVGVKVPSEEVGSDSECAVTVEQAVKRFIFTRGRSKASRNTDNVVGGDDAGTVEMQRQSHKDQNPRNEKKVQRRKRGLGYKCIACTFETVYKSEYQRHIRKAHSMSTYTCSGCNQEFKVMAKVLKHVEEGPCRGAKVDHTPNHLGSLMITKQKLESRTSLEERDKLTGFVFQVRFPYDESSIHLDVSRDLCVGQQGIITLSMRCSECDYLAPSFKQAQAHFRHHWRYLPALCCFCGRCLPSRYRLIQHVSSFIHDHLKEESLVAVKSDINQSVGADEVKHSANTSQLTCPKCSRKFVQSTGLAQHLISYHQVLKLEKQFHCGHCNDTYTKRSDLLAHLRVQHQGELQTCDYVCPVCERGFKVKSHALRHRECLHSPVQQVPYDAYDLEPSTLDLDILCSDPSQEQHSCFVCFQVFNGRAAYLEHMYRHRVWVAHPTRGSKPRDLFEQILDSRDGSTVMKIRVKMELDLNSRLLTEEERDSLLKKVNMIAEKRRRKIKVKGIQGQRKGHSEQELDSILLGEDLPQVADAVSVLQSMADNIPKPSCTGSNHFHLQDYTENSDVAVDNTQITMEMDEDNSGQLVKNQSDEVSREEIGCELIVNSPGLDVPDRRETEASDSQQHGEAGGASGGGSTVHVEESQENEEESEGKNQRFICAFCLTLADSLEEMYNHTVHTHSLVATFRCVKSECGLHFDTVDEYEGHSRIHSQKAFICNICNWHVERASQLQAHKSGSHKSLHWLDTGHCCQVCHKTFVSETALVQHINRDPHHHQCPHCSKVFKSKADLADHEMTHNSVKSLLCDQCGATFVNKLTLNRHRQVHSKRNHHCKLCPLSFNKREHLRRHLSTIHSNEKPHRCNYPGCEKRFKRKDKMHEHLKKHSPDKPYICNLCGRRYRYREGLRYHEKTHNSEGHYQCSKCHVHFNRPSMLQQHLQQQHNITTSKRLLYPCELCNMAFQRPERRSRHMERAHNITVDWPLRCDLCGRGFPGEKSFETHMKERHGNTNKGGKKQSTTSAPSKVDKFMAEDGGQQPSAMATNDGNWNQNPSALQSSGYVEDKREEETALLHYRDTDMVQQAINQTIQLEGYPLDTAGVLYNPHTIQILPATDAPSDKPAETLQWYAPPAIQTVDPNMQGGVVTATHPQANNLAAFHVENLGQLAVMQSGHQAAAGGNTGGIIQLNLNGSQLVNMQNQVTIQPNGNAVLATVGDAQGRFQLDPSTGVSEQTANASSLQEFSTIPKDPWTESARIPKTKVAQTPKKRARAKKAPMKKPKKSGAVGTVTGQEVKLQYDGLGKEMSHSQLLMQLQQQAIAHQLQQQEDAKSSQPDLEEPAYQPSTELNQRAMNPEASTTLLPTAAPKSGFEPSITLNPQIHIQGVTDPNPVPNTGGTAQPAAQTAAAYNTASLPRDLTDLLMKNIVSQVQKQQFQPPQPSVTSMQVFNQKNLGAAANLPGLAHLDNGQLKITMRDLSKHEETSMGETNSTSQLQQLLQGASSVKHQVFLPIQNLVPTLTDSGGIQQTGLNPSQQQSLMLGAGAVPEEQASEVPQMGESHENSMRLPHQTQVVHWQADGTKTIKHLPHQVELPLLSQQNIPIGCTFTPQAAPLAAHVGGSLVQNFVPSIVIPVSSSSTAEKPQQPTQLGALVGGQFGDGLPQKLGAEQTSLLYQQLMGTQQTGQEVQQSGETAPQAAVFINSSMPYSMASIAPVMSQHAYIVAAAPSLGSSTQPPSTYLFTPGGGATGGVNPTHVSQSQLLLTPATLPNQSQHHLVAGGETNADQAAAGQQQPSGVAYNMLEGFSQLKAEETGEKDHIVLLS